MNVLGYWQVSSLPLLFSLCLRIDLPCLHRPGGFWLLSLPPCLNTDDIRRALRSLAICGRIVARDASFAARGRATGVIRKKFFLRVPQIFIAKLISVRKACIASPRVSAWIIARRQDKSRGARERDVLRRFMCKFDDYARKFPHPALLLHVRQLAPGLQR